MSTLDVSVHKKNELANLDDIRSSLDGLIERRDGEAIADGRAQAEAYAAYERRQGAQERADYFSRIKVMAEAALGVLDLDRVPYGARKRGKEVPPRTFKAEAGNDLWKEWRTLGQGQLEGVLDKTLNVVADLNDPAGSWRTAKGAREITTVSVAQELRRIGVGYVKPGPIVAALKTEHERSRGFGPHNGTGLRMSEVASRADVSYAMVMGLMGPNAPRRIARVHGEALAEVLGVTGLKRAPAKNRQRRYRRLRPARQPKGGRWDQAYSLHRKTMEEVFAVTGESQNDEVWGHLHAVEDFLKRRI